MSMVTRKYQITIPICGTEGIHVETLMPLHGATKDENWTPCKAELSSAKARCLPFGRNPVYFRIK